MKKLLLLLLCLTIILSFSACGGSGDAVPADSGSESEAGDDAAPSGEYFTFATETFGGEAFTSDDLKDAKVVMINMWEPWCGPCVGEMPDLEKLYQKYKDQGFVILGVFSDTTADDDATKVLEDTGVTYPILRMSKEFAGFQTGYVPTTVFLTGEGALLHEDPVIGAHTYEEWDRMVSGLLEALG